MCGATARCWRGCDPSSPRSSGEEDHARQAEAECIALWTQGLQTAETARRLAHTIDGHELMEGDSHKVTLTGRMLAMWFGKLLSIAGVILLVLAVSPMGDAWDPRKSSLANTWRWIRNPRPDLATAVTVDPRLLYGGAFCAIIGILWSSSRQHGGMLREPLGTREPA